MSSSGHANNQTKNILILGKCITQGLDDATLTAEKMYSINSFEHDKKFCLSLHYNGSSNYLFVNGKEIINFKATDSEIVASKICLGNVSNGFLLDNTVKERLECL